MAAKAKAQKTAFLSEGYKIPNKKKQFLKLREGENHIRICSPALFGWQIFDQENQPHRRDMDNPFTVDDLRSLKIEKDDEGNFREPAHFWAMLVYSYDEDAYRICMITQSTVQMDILGYFNDKAWGDPREYDIKIVRKGTSKTDTEYSLKVLPKKKLSKDLVARLDALIDRTELDKLMQGDYPMELDVIE